MKSYLVAATKTWHRRAFQKHAPSLPGHWHLVDRPEALTRSLVEEIAPRYIFFAHWSWTVPQDILALADCVCFHASDVPYGRGGSPIQNLIVRGHRDTKLTALRMVEELDAGPVYLKRDLSLEGRAQDIFERMADLTWGMIASLVEHEPHPEPQNGDATVFKRRTPDQSVLPGAGPLNRLYDHIRMLDADGYPHAFLEHGEFRLDFTEASLDEGKLTARVTLTKEMRRNAR